MTDLSLDVYVSPEHAIPSGGHFSATSATLILGETEVVLVDTGFTLSDVEEIARRIDASGRTLTYICITHAHADHYFGIEWLLERYPEARAVAANSVAEAIAENISEHRRRWKEWLAGVALDNSIVPDKLDGASIAVDGYRIDVIEVGQGDIADSSIIHVPALSAVMAGDVVYNGFNPFMAATGPDEWADWISSIEKIESLNPEIVVAGHKTDSAADDAQTALNGTRDYLRTFRDELEKADGTRTLVAAMQERFPNLGNSSALITSAKTAMQRKRNEHA